MPESHQCSWTSWKLVLVLAMSGVGVIEHGGVVLNSDGTPFAGFPTFASSPFFLCTTSVSSRAVAGGSSRIFIVNALDVRRAH